MENKQYICILPNESNEKQEFKTKTNSIIIVGANGSGKSRLGAWMEKNCESIYRIPAQRDVTISKNGIRYNYKEAKNNLFYGTLNDKNKQNAITHKYYEFKNATIKLYSDYDKLLNFILATEHEQLRKDRKNNSRTENIIDEIKNIWKEIFSHREIDLKEDEFLCIMDKQNEYEARMMSDGERAILYLIMYVLCIEEKIILIDEPELHLHPSLTNKLWDILEKHRQDCLFIYITHDLNFASSHTNSDKFWIKSYNGKKWEFKKISTNEIMPQELFLKLLGARRNILFIEGENNSLDFKIYSALYPQYQIITCGSCEKVVQYTKAFNEQNALHGFKAYGIIDRDYRSQNEINALMKKDINVLKVAEVENLFLLECIILAILKQSNREDEIKEIKNYIFEIKFKNCLEKQILENLKSEIK
ncbi:TPA: AAA family ATPase, partial [Campylobacter jejuni]|nr:AAA family ATPase [Campylobacter jejuni]